eukprot:7380124-Prymnesium_polylepis.1
MHLALADVAFCDSYQSLDRELCTCAPRACHRASHLIRQWMKAVSSGRVRVIFTRFKRLT